MHDGMMQAIEDDLGEWALMPACVRSKSRAMAQDLGCLHKRQQMDMPHCPVMSSQQSGPGLSSSLQRCAFHPYFYGGKADSSYWSRTILQRPRAVSCPRVSNAAGTRSQVLSQWSSSILQHQHASPCTLCLRLPIRSCGQHPRHGQRAAIKPSCLRRTPLQLDLCPYPPCSRPHEQARRCTQMS